jgi:hypothetical protein
MDTLYSNQCKDLTSLKSIPTDAGSETPCGLFVNFKAEQ